jgi:hypothetical protein
VDHLAFEVDGRPGLALGAAELAERFERIVREARSGNQGGGDVLSIHGVPSMFIFAAPGFLLTPQD